jgi:hypothetical protein
MNTELDQFIKMIKHPAKSRMFLFLKLPSAFFSGVRIRKISATACTVVVPYKWFSQNPFRSTYFACLAMAAELSTGALAMAHLYKRKERVSMLVTAMNARFSKKATGRTYFICEDGEAFKKAIDQAVETGNGVNLTATSTGTNEQGDVVGVFTFQWSFKLKA